MLPHPSIKILVHVICEYTKARNLASALCMHVYLGNTGLQAHKLLGNYLLSMLTEVGSMCSALKVFDTLASRDEAGWDYLINGFIKCGETRHAFVVYQKMQQECLLPPRTYTFVALSKACAKLKDAKRAQHIYAHIVQTGLLKTDIYVGGALVDMLAKCGLLAKAQDVFDVLPVRNVVIWNALIGGYVCQGHNAEALTLFEEMQLKGISPNVVTFIFSLKACGNKGASDKGSEIHWQIAKEGLLKNRFVCSALVDMYSRCGLLEKAQEVFKMLPFKDTATWNALITGYVQLECSEEALNLFEDMQRGGVPPNVVTFACILKACGSIRAIDKGSEIHAEVFRKGLHNGNVFVGSGLVDMYAKCGALARAQEVFDLLQVRSVVTWNALIAGYMHHEHNEEVLDCFELMKADGVSPNPVTYACSLKACGNIGAADKGNEIQEEVTRRGLLTTNVYVGSALVDMYAKCGLLASAQSVFDTLPVRNVVTWNALITGYAQLGKVESAFCTFDKMRKEGSEPDRVAFLSVLTACSHAGLVEIAQTYFEAMSEDYGIPPCLNHHTCLVDLFGRTGQLDKAAEITKEIPWLPNTVTWLAILGACRYRANVELGKQAFKHAVRLDETLGAAYICMQNIYTVDDMLENGKQAVTQ